MAFNVAMIVFPENLSYDWQMGSIPLIASVRDHRNLLTLTVIAFIVIICIKFQSLILDVIKRVLSALGVGLNGKQEMTFIANSCHSLQVSDENEEVCKTP